MTQPLRLSPDSLLAHEPFVRAVVRDLLKDEHRVQDVLQETWIRALDKGPREGGSLKGWLARVARRLAIDEHRGSARRERRERETARGEALESVDALHARLEAQREVVDAVLALEEPYKSVVLLAYYEQLAPQAIGARLGRSAATVRSQLSRAHEILKRKLDHEHGGDRSAWAGVLLPWALATKSKAGVLVAAGIGVALIGAGAWVLPRVMSDGHSREAAALELAVQAPDSPADNRSVLDAGSSPSSRSVAGVLVTQKQVEPPAGVPDLHLATLGNGELMNLAVQTMRALEKKLLTPDPRFAEQEKALLAMPDTGLVRLVLRKENGAPFEGMIFPREGGCFFSFATLSHDYDREADIFYEQDSLKAQSGMILQVGDIPLADIKPSAATPPSALSAEARAPWELLFTRIDGEDDRGMEALSKRQVELHLPAAPAVVGRSYVLRGFTRGGHDQLVAVRVLGKDEGSITLSWRMLLRWPRPGEEHHYATKPAFAEVPAGPSWMEGVSADELVKLLHSIRGVSEPRVLEVPKELVASSAWLRAGADGTSGCFRVLPEHQFRPLVEVPYAGTYYSIEERRYLGWDGCEIGLLYGEFSAACGGGTGWMLDLGELSRDELPGVLLGEAPKRIAKADLEKWSFLWEARSALRPGWKTPERFVKPEEFARANEMRLRQPVTLKVGHSFLLRSIVRSGADHLLLMTTLETSKDGTSFSWRELKRFDR
jgi:RNA polymerase sigma-70 factor (ECF subfamily)